MPAILRYRGYLEELGSSFADREDANVGLVLQQPHILANIRELGRGAQSAVRLTADLQAANETLTARLESLAN